MLNHGLLAGGQSRNYSTHKRGFVVQEQQRNPRLPRESAGSTQTGGSLGRNGLTHVLSLGNKQKVPGGALLMLLF